jgi:hypothetical protein
MMRRFPHTIIQYSILQWIGIENHVCMWYSMKVYEEKWKQDEYWLNEWLYIIRGFWGCSHNDRFRAVISTGVHILFLVIRRIFDSTLNSKINGIEWKNFPPYDHVLRHRFKRELHSNKWESMRWNRDRDSPDPAHQLFWLHSFNVISKYTLL